MFRRTKKNKIQNCWEFLDCPIEIKEKCEAYKQNLGDICWFVAQEQDKGTPCFGLNKYKGCYNCPWYKYQSS